MLHTCLLSYGVSTIQDVQMSAEVSVRSVCRVSYALLTLGAHAQKGYGTCLVCVSVCVSVCLSVTTPAPTSLVSTP